MSGAEGSDWLWSPRWMRDGLDLVFGSLCHLSGLQEHHFCLVLLFSALTLL